MQTSGELLKNNSVAAEKLMDELQPFLTPYQSIPTGNFVIDNYLRSGSNTYYGFKSAYTGLDITATAATQKPGGETITDADVDNVTYFKFDNGVYGKRVWPFGIVVADEFGLDSESNQDITASFNKASEFARDNKKSLQLGDGSFLVNGELKVYTDFKAKGEFIFSQSTSKLSVNPSSAFIPITASTLTGLTAGSTKCPELVGYKGCGLLLRSSAEVLINRWDSGPINPYYKRQFLQITDDEGTFNSYLQQSYNDLSSLTVRVYLPEDPITLEGIKVRVTSYTDQQQPMVFGRSNITLKDCKLKNEDAITKGYIGMAINTAYNVNIDNCDVSGFNDDGNGGLRGRLGYGIQLTDVYNVNITRCNVDECKHTIMVGYGTDITIDGCTLTGVDDSGSAATSNLQPLDAHWCYNMTVRNCNLFSKYGSLTGVSVAGGNIKVENCNINNCWSISAMSTTTPEISGYWIAENNTIRFTDGASFMHAMGVFTLSSAYEDTFERTLNMPQLIRIKDNKFINPNVDKQFILYRGESSILPLGKNITQRYELINNSTLSGELPSSAFAAILLSVRDENKTPINPQIIIENQDFKLQDYDAIAVALRITSRLKNTMSNPYGYDVYLRNVTGLSTAIDIDACNSFFMDHVDILSLNGGQSLVGGEVEVPSFYYDLNGCTIGKHLPISKTSAYLNVGSARVMMRDCTIYSNFAIRGSADGSIGSTQFTNFDEGIIVSKGNSVIKGTQFDVNSLPIEPLFKTDNWVNKTFFEITNDDAFVNYATQFPVISTDILTGKYQLVRFNDNSFSIMVNNGGTISDPLKPQNLGISSTTSITPLRKITYYRCNSATDITVTINASAYVDAGFPITFYNSGTGKVSIAAGAGVTMTGAPFVLQRGDELVLVTSGVNTWTIVSRKSKQAKRTPGDVDATIAMADFGNSDTLVIYGAATTTGRTLTLPSAVNMDGFTIIVIRTDATGQTLTIKGNGSEDISSVSGTANTDVFAGSTQYQTRTYKSNGTKIFRY